MFRLFLLLLTVVYLLLAFNSGKVIFVIITLGLGAWWLYELKKEVEKRNEAISNETIQKVEQHPHTRYIISSDYLSALMLDERTDTLRILEREQVDEDFDKKEFDFKELYEIAIVEDGNNVALTSKGGVHGWSLIDGGTKVDVHVKNKVEESSEESENEEEEVKKLMLKIVVDDLSDPIVEYVFLDNDQEIPRELDEYKELFKECSKWYQKISVIIKRHEHEQKIQEVQII